jgi:hypothetical protein
MYPALLLEVDYPVSKPKILVCPPVAQMVDQNNCLLYGGIISALMLPCSTPGVTGILPYRINKNGQSQVFYALCATCAQQGLHGGKNLIKCTHTIRERALRGVWTSIELSFALEHNYRMLECYQVRYTPPLFYIKNIVMICLYITGDIL